MKSINSKEEKAYKLLAIQEKISNRQAKDLIDRGLVFAKGRKINVARGELKIDTKFTIQKHSKPKIIFEDNKVFVVNKPPYMSSEEISEMFGFDLLHRLDKQTSGVLVLYKDEEFAKKAIAEFRKKKVEKTYFAIVDGKVPEDLDINSPILTKKTKGRAISVISKDGKEAHTLVIPKMILGNLSLVEVKIITGRTHQIRAHLKSVKHSILGDEQYGGRFFNRLMLHSFEMKIFDYVFIAKLPDDFKKLGFELD